MAGQGWDAPSPERPRAQLLTGSARVVRGVCACCMVCLRMQGRSVVPGLHHEPARPGGDAYYALSARSPHSTPATAQRRGRRLANELESALLTESAPASASASPSAAAAGGVSFSPDTT